MIKKSFLVLLSLSILVLSSPVFSAPTFIYEDMSEPLSGWDEYYRLDKVTGLTHEDGGTYTAQFYWQMTGADVIALLDSLGDDYGSYNYGARAGDIVKNGAESLIDALGDSTDSTYVFEYGNNGVVARGSDAFFAPYYYKPGYYSSTLYGVGDFNASYDIDPTTFTYREIDFSPSSTDNFVFFSESSEVPLPASLWLLGSAMLGITGFSRIFKKKS